MADYTHGEDVTHYPGDGHTQCEILVELKVEGEEPKPFTVGDAAQYRLTGQTFDNETDYLHALSQVAIRYPDEPNREPAFHKTPVTVQDQIREINEYGWQGKMRNPEYHAGMFLRSLGVDLTKEHHSGTPRRLAAAMKELTVREEFTFTTFEAKSQNMITLGPIPFYTMCAHHTLPFHGNAWIGYVPYQRIAGLSKFARAVGYVSKGFHVQEELTTELHDFLETTLQTKGLAVVMKAEHMCMAMRGVRASGVITTTSEMSGVFADHNRTAKAEFLEWIRG